MKIGVKTYDDGNFLEHFRKKANFFEIMAVEGRDYEFTKQFSQFPVVIHAQHYIFDDNPADKTKREKGTSSINFARKVADFAKAKRIILHPGIAADNNCSEENAIAFVKSLKDNRIVIENQPKVKYLNCLCTTPEDTKEFMEKANVEFCFDINHAIETAVCTGTSYKEFIKEFIKLNPAQYHLGGQRFDKGSDGRILSHLSFQDSEIDLKEILKFLPEDAEITLETEHDMEKTEKDIKMIRKVIEEINQKN